MLQPGIILNIALNSVLMLIILAFGRVLHTTGRPYLTGLLVTHILATTVLVGYIILILFPFIISDDQVPGLTALITGGIIFLLIIILSGILLSLERYLIPSLWLHRFATLGFLVALTGIVWRIAAA